MLDRDINHCVPELVAKDPLIRAAYEKIYPTRSLRVIGTLRSTAEQFELFRIGRALIQGKWVVVNKNLVVTNIDGVTVFSKHNPIPGEPKSRAMDYGVFIDGKYRAGYKDTPLYYPLLEIARDVGLVSGGDFSRTGLPLGKLLAQKKWRDWPHMETPGNP